MSIAHKSNRLGVNPGQPWIEFDNEGRVIDMDIRKSRRFNLWRISVPDVFDYECPELVDLYLYSYNGFVEVTSDFPKLEIYRVSGSGHLNNPPVNLLGHFPRLKHLESSSTTIGEIRYGFPALQRATHGFDSCVMSKETANFIMESLPAAAASTDPNLWSIGFAGSRDTTTYKDLGTLIDPTIATKKGWTVQLTSGDVKP